MFGDPDYGDGKECFYCAVPASTPTPSGGGSPPAAPSPVSASNGNACGTIYLSWSSVSGATSYDVFRSTAETIPGSPIASGVTSTSYTDTSPGTAGEYYRVEAVNARRVLRDAGRAEWVST